MSESSAQTNQYLWMAFRIITNLLVCVAIIFGAIYAVIWINKTEPVAEKLNATRKSAALVETQVVERGTYYPQLTVLGTVQAAQQINLRPRVSGQLVELTLQFAPGGMVKKGDLLLRIDPADFENALSISESELKQAEASMRIEEARQRLAAKELKLLEGKIDETNRGLVMREPQLASIKAQVSAAEAAVARAKLDLERTKIFAPFDAQVITRNVDIGSQVGPGNDLARLVGVDEYWIMATVPVRSLRWIQFPEFEPTKNSTNTTLTSDDDDDEPKGPNPDTQKSENDDPRIVVTEPTKPGSNVILRNPDAWGVDVERKAVVMRLIGTLDQQTRLARVLVSVKDPLGIESEVPPLILGSLLETTIEGKPIENVVRLERSYVRNQDTVWVMKDKKLEIRETEIVFRDAEYVYIRSGLEHGDEVVTSTLATVAPGVGLRRIGEPAEDDAKAEKVGQ